MNTLKIAPLQANAMVYFTDMAEAARAVIAMRTLGVSAAEMLDKRSLASVNAGEIEGLTAVLTMVEAEDQHELADKVTNLAIENDTSFNNIVIKILESYFEQQENNKD